MIHAVYQRLNKKALWQLVSVSASAETVLRDKQQAMLKAKKAGQDDAEVAITTYDEIWWVPENTVEIKDRSESQLYN